MAEQKVVSDNVNSPAHYCLPGGIEVIDVRFALMQAMDEQGVPAAEVDCWSRAWEYLTRMHKKGGLEDAKKSQWYLARLISLMEQNND